MKYVSYGLLAAFLAQGVYAAIPTSAESWYTPNGGMFKTTSSTGFVYYFDELGGWVQDAIITVDEDGNITGYDGNIDELGPAYPAYLAMVEALHAETLAKRNKERIEAIGENLENPLDIAPVLLFVCFDGKRQVVRCGRENGDRSVVNRRFCSRTKDQRGNGCSAYGVATYIEFINSYTGKDMWNIDVAEMNRYAMANAPQNLKGGNTRSCDCFEWAAKQMPDEDYAAAQISLLNGRAVGGYNDIDDIRAATIRLVTDFGGFLASVDTTDEWVLLDLRCANACRQTFGRHAKEITGRNVKVSVEGCAQVQVSGSHCVVVYGWDDDFVYFQNAWGDAWGDCGHAKITWSEFARQFKMAEIFAPRLEIVEWLRRFPHEYANPEWLRIEAATPAPPPNG